MNTQHRSVRHVVTSITDEANGLAYSVPSMAAATARQGWQVEIVTLGARKMPDEAVICREFRRDYSALPILKSLGASSPMRAYLLSDPQPVLHGHGLWMMPNVYVGDAVRRNQNPLILAPRGMLGASALSFSPRKKKAFWSLWQRAAVETVTCWHATSIKEAEDIRAFGMKQPIAIVPNGIDMPVMTKTLPAGRERTLLFLGRIHPKKGVDTLLKAWAMLEPLFPDWRLRIAGPDEGDYARDCREFIVRNGLSRANLCGPVFGDEKLKCYSDADIFVLPTLDENFGMTVAEALAAGTPVVCSKGAPWSGLIDHRCGWWHPIGERPLFETLSAAMSVPDEDRLQLGMRGRAWMENQFAWPKLAEMMIEVYRWMNGDGVRPSHVHSR